jgi:hypothetical protein
MYANLIVGMVSDQIHTHVYLTQCQTNRNKNSAIFLSFFQMSRLFRRLPRIEYYAQYIRFLTIYFDYVGE